VGYNFFNPTPAGGIAPAPTGGAMGPLPEGAYGTQPVPGVTYPANSDVPGMMPNGPIPPQRSNGFPTNQQGYPPAGSPQSPNLNGLPLPPPVEPTPATTQRQR